MHYETIPPYRNISSKPISLTSASQLLDKYLLNSEAHPHLHPDALMTPTGVTFSSHGGPMGGVVMHNLRRVAAGLRGEYLEPEATPEPEEHTGGASSWKGQKGKRKGGDADITAGAEEEWQNMSEFEREEGQVDAGDAGDRILQEGREAPEIVASAGAEESEEVPQKKRKTDDGKTDKETRKKAKQERNKQFKKQKAKTTAGTATS